VVVGATLVVGSLTLPGNGSNKPIRTDILGAALGVVVGAIWVWWELRTSEPLVQLRLLRVPAVLAADIATLLGG
jgi:hypothetical protein